MQRLRPTAADTEHPIIYIERAETYKNTNISSFQTVFSRHQDGVPNVEESHDSGMDRKEIIVLRIC